MQVMTSVCTEWMNQLFGFQLIPCQTSEPFYSGVIALKLYIGLICFSCNTASVFLHHRGATMQAEASITITIYTKPQSDNLSVPETVKEKVPWK